MATVLLTPTFVLNCLKCPPGLSKIEYCDTHPESKGLYIEISANSQNIGIYRLRQKIDGKSTHFLIGKTDSITLDSARRQVAVLKNQINSGTNPKTVAEKKKQEAMTLKQFFDHHYYPFVISRKKSHLRDKQLFARVNIAMGATKLTEISRLMLTDFHNKLFKVDKLSPASCDLHIRFIKHALQLAVDWSMLEKNVASRFPMFNVDNRSSDFLTDAELQRFIQTVQASGNKVIANLIMFMLSSGMRVSEAMAIRWSDVNMENRTISIPARNNKSRRLKSIPLSDMAAEAIQSQSANRGLHEYIWINPRTKERYKNIHLPFNILRERANLPTFKIHGLRRAFATTLANNGTSINVIQQLLTHASPVTTDRYIRISSDTLHSASNGVSSIIRAAMLTPAVV